MKRRMNLQQVCNKFNYSQSYVTKNFKKFQSAIFKKWGIVLIKQGRGSNADYIIVEDNSRALTLYQQDDTRTVMLSKTSLKHIMNMDFATFMGIVMTPLQVYRGSYDDFLKYIEVNNTPSNRQNLKASLEFLTQNDYIHYQIDKTDEDYFFAGIYKKTQEEITVGLTMIKKCKQLAMKYNKRSWVPMLKLWLGIKYFYIQDYQPFTIRDLTQLTGLSAYQIRQNGKILQADNTFISDKVYASYVKCVGKCVELNGLHEGNLLGGKLR